MTSSVPPAVRQLREMALSAAWAASIRAAAKIGVADALGDEPAPVDDLAKAVKADPEALNRLLRALACHGIFDDRGDGVFAHTDVSRLLRDDHPNSLRYMTLWATEPWTWELWARLDESILSGENVFQSLHGKDFFDYLHADAPESAAVFDKAMTQASRLSARRLADTLDLSGVGTVVDIAGGQGQVLATLLEANPEVRGVLFDLPEVVANPDPRLAEGGALASRAELVAGDCRRKVGVPADLYLLKNVLEWDDDSTVDTLRNLAVAAKPGARIVIVENLIDGSPESRFTTAMDLLLLLNVGGKKHTQDGLVKLVSMAGLRVEEVRPVNAYLHMVVATVSS